MDDTSSSYWFSQKNRNVIHGESLPPHYSSLHQAVPYVINPFHPYTSASTSVRFSNYGSACSYNNSAHSDYMYAPNSYNQQYPQTDRSAATVYLDRRSDATSPSFATTVSVPRDEFAPDTEHHMHEALARDLQSISFDDILQPSSLLSAPQLDGASTHISVEYAPSTRLCEQRTWPDLLDMPAVSEELQFDLQSCDFTSSQRARVDSDARDCALDHRIVGPYDPMISYCSPSSAHGEMTSVNDLRLRAPCHDLSCDPLHACDCDHLGSSLTDSNCSALDHQQSLSHSGGGALVYCDQTAVCADPGSARLRHVSSSVPVRRALQLPKHFLCQPSASSTSSTAATAHRFMNSVSPSACDIFSPESFEGSFHSDPPLTPDHLDSDCVECDEGFKSTSPGSKQERYFWQYNVQSKGPKGSKVPLCGPDFNICVSNCDTVDPVFLPSFQTNSIRHSGKARRGDGNDLNPCPHKLLAIKFNIDRLNGMMNDLCVESGADCATAGYFDSRFQNKREKNKLASRSCRLKKKAQHEAYKIQLAGLKDEYKRLCSGYNDIALLLDARVCRLKENHHAGSTDELSMKIDRIYNALCKNEVAGGLEEYVQRCLNKCDIISNKQKLV